jgi:hypothetical protein
MAYVKGTYVTKYDAGGSGDNIIPDGYIKSVEKVWIDTYAFTSANTIGSTLVIECAVIPKGKKITGVTVQGLGAVASTTVTLAIGTKIISTAVTNATALLAATVIGSSSQTLGMPLQANVNLPLETTADTKVILSFGAASMTVTSGTITTIVRYT